MQRPMGERWLLQGAQRALAACAMAVVFGTASAAELRVGFTQDALTLDPANHRKRETETIIRNLYDGIMTQTAKSEVVPEIAESLRQVDGSIATRCVSS